ncbi:hypothetical protein TNCV_2027491 [Trichonephila clavipes]|nr:hypothetical protein TNCV_2027491 [Trichonephila clavipes]
MVGVPMFKPWVQVLVQMKTLQEEGRNSKSSCWGRGSVKSEMPKQEGGKGTHELSHGRWAEDCKIIRIKGHEREMSRMAAT